MPRSPRRNRALLAAGSLVLLGLVACTEVPATQQAEQVRSLYEVISILAAPVVVVVEGLLLWYILRFRKRDDYAVELSSDVRAGSSCSPSTAHSEQT